MPYDVIGRGKRCDAIFYIVLCSLISTDSRKDVGDVLELLALCLRFAFFAVRRLDSTRAVAWVGVHGQMRFF